MGKIKGNEKIVSIVKLVIAMGVGAGAVYLANYKKIEFMNRYPQFLEADEFAKETLEIKVPENPSGETVGKAYFALFDDKYTFMEENLSPFSVEYALKNVNESTTAKESGFKIQFNENGLPYFSAIVEDSPADKQGLKVGDVIVDIDDFKITEYRHAVRLVGEDGKIAKLIIQRDGEEISMDFVRSSDDEKEAGIRSEMYGDTLYISADTISYETADAFIKKVESTEFESIIIDLRENGGGHTEMAVKMADMFIDSAKVIQYSQNGEEMISETTDGVEFDVPIVLLVNEKTASAAEIMTALLKQYGDTKIVGMQTFGKGIFQSQALFYGSSLRYTEGYYTVGDWECYQGVGIKPDYEIDMDSDYICTINDIQLQFAVDLLK